MSTNVVFNRAQKLCKSIPSSGVFLQSFFMPFSCDGLPLAGGALSQCAKVCCREKTRFCSLQKLASEKKQTIAGYKSMFSKKNMLLQVTTTPCREKTSCRTLQEYYGPQINSITH